MNPASSTKFLFKPNQYLRRLELFVVTICCTNVIFSTIDTNGVIYHYSDDFYKKNGLRMIQRKTTILHVIKVKDSYGIMPL